MFPKQPDVEDRLTYVQGYLKANGITNGANNMGKRCHEAQAVTAFLWFGFATFLGSLVFSALASRGSSVRTGGIRRGVPAMSQV